MNANELDAAIFDLGGVLTSPIYESFMEFEREIGLPEGTFVRIFAASYSEEGQADFHLLEVGKITEAEYYKRLEAKIRDLGIEVRFPEDPVAIRQGLFRTLHRNHEMIEAVSRISEHYPTGLLTNNVREWGGWREYYPADIFDVVVDSSEVGLRKPDPAIYRLTCERLGVEPDRAAFVDDIGANVEAARALGLVAIHFTGTEEALAQIRPLFPKAFA